MQRPLLICLTPVKNEAWILQAFLQAASLWADYIIIADQGSTDGSREIALEYPKVILIDNNTPDFNEADRQRLLINRAREIEGDKSLFALDADEILSANFAITQDWQKILHSKPGDVFWFRWANLYPDMHHYWPSEIYFPWMFHDDGIEPHGNYVRNIHSMRIPYPIEEKQMYYVNDFHVLHFAYVYPNRVAAKMRFYKFTDLTINNRNPITLSRFYKNCIPALSSNRISLPDNYINFGFDLLAKIERHNDSFWFDSYIANHINNDNYDQICKIDIWEEPLLSQIAKFDHRTILIRVVHYYLEITKQIANYKIIKLTDKILSKLKILG